MSDHALQVATQERVNLAKRPARDDAKLTKGTKSKKPHDEVEANVPVTSQSKRPRTGDEDVATPLTRERVQGTLDTPRQSEGRVEMEIGRDSVSVLSSKGDTTDREFEFPDDCVDTQALQATLRKAIANVTARDSVESWVARELGLNYNLLRVAPVPEEDDQPYPADDDASDFEEVHQMRVEWKKTHPLAFAAKQQARERLKARTEESAASVRGNYVSQWADGYASVGKSQNIFVTGHAPSLETVTAQTMREFVKQVRKHFANNKSNTNHPSTMLTVVAEEMLQLLWETAIGDSGGSTYEEAKQMPPEMWLTRMEQVVMEMTNTTTKSADLQLSSLGEADKWMAAILKMAKEKSYLSEDKLVEVVLNGLDNFPGVREKVEDQLAKRARDRGVSPGFRLCLGIAYQMVNLARDLVGKEKVPKVGEVPKPQQGNPHSSSQPKHVTVPKPAPAGWGNGMKKKPYFPTPPSDLKNPKPEVKCYQCGKMGHMARDCREGKK